VKNISQFKCSNCGACCRNVEGIKELESTNGICNNLDLKTNTCKIYNERPSICRVNDYYYNNKINMSLKQWHIMNTKACHILIDKQGLDPKFKIDIKSYERE
tara:strand:+ start:147 stop:452 length:306 start_codon:yes stop_codon:yes gene_type:complete